MSPKRLISMVSVLGLAVCLPAAALAFQPDKQPTARMATPSADIPVVTMKFKGGTVGEYVATLRQAIHPRSFNVVFKGSAEKVEIPPIDLSNVSIGTAMRTLDRLYEPREGQQIDINQVIESFGDPVYVIMFRSNDALRSAAPQSTDVFSIRSLTEPTPNDPEGVMLTMSSSVVLSALEAILNGDEQDGQQAATLKYHPDSGLVVVRAYEEQLLLVRRAIGTMQDDTDRRRQSYAGIDLPALQLQYDRAVIQVQRARSGLEQASAELDRMNKLTATGQVSTQERAASEGRVRGAELDVRTAELDVEMLHKRLEKIRKIQPATSNDKPAQ